MTQDTNTASGAAITQVLAYLDGLSDDAAAHIYPSDLEKCMTSECVVEVASVRAGNGYERTVPLFSREQVVEALASAPAQPAGMTDDEKHLRRMLCVAHAGALAYMDDGEASDSRLHPTIDFLRDSPKDIQRKIWERNRAAFTAAPAQPVAEPTHAQISALSDIDALAQEIRLVDGNHKMGAGALAEALMPFLRAYRRKTLRLLTQDERDSLGRRAEGMDGNEWDQWVQEKFAQVNGLKVQGGSYEWE